MEESKSVHTVTRVVGSEGSVYPGATSNQIIAPIGLKTGGVNGVAGIYFGGMGFSKNSRMVGMVGCI